MTHVLANTDSYKLSHKGFMDEGTTMIYSNLTARTDKYAPVLKDRYDQKVVFFGLQYFLISYLVEEWNTTFFSKPKDRVISRFKRIIDAYLGPDSVPMEHFEELHDLGYLPIEIKALPEGSRVNLRVPMVTIKNTHPKFAWLTNYLETVWSCETWKPITTATIIDQYRRLVNEYALKTTGSLDGTNFQVHGFEFRGMAGRHDAAINAAAFLLSSNGTDTVPAIELIEEYYAADAEQEFIATSVPASEHSIMCTGTEVRGELESYRKYVTEDYPTGVVSLVSDTYDYWKVITEYLPALKEDILARPENALGLSKVVIRPDSGDPVDIICGTVTDIIDLPEQLNVGDVDEICAYCADELAEKAMESAEHGEPGDDVVQCIVRDSNGATAKVVAYVFWNRHDKTYYYFDGLERMRVYPHTLTPEEKGSIECMWEIFGGTVTEQGYKQLDPHIGLIYGDSITLERAEQILSRLEAKGFASTNVILGVGSYTMQYLTRDSFGMAVKATYAEVDGKGYELYKDPKTDDGTKKSAKGLLRVEREGDDYVLCDQQTIEQEKQGELRTVFKDGVLMNVQSYAEIRERLANGG